MASLIAQNFDAALHRAAWSKLSREGLDSIIRVHNRYLNVMSSDNALEHELIHSGLPTVNQVGSDTVPTPTVDFTISPKVVYRHDEYRYKYVYTRVAAADDQYGSITDVIGTMGEGAAYRMELQGADLINNGTAAGSYADWNGDALFNTAHALVGSSTTYSNITAPGGPSYATLGVIYAYFRRVLNDVGQYTPVAIQAIMCSPELAPLWRQLLGSNTAYGRLALSGTGTGSNAAFAEATNDADGIENTFQQLGLTADKVIENPYLTNIEDTIVIGQNHKMNMFVREAPNTDTYNVDDPKAIAHRIQMRFSVGFTDGRRVLQIPGS